MLSLEEIMISSSSLSDSFKVIDSFSGSLTRSIGETRPVEESETDSAVEEWDKWVWLIELEKKSEQDKEKSSEWLVEWLEQEVESEKETEAWQENTD